VNGPVLAAAHPSIAQTASAIRSRTFLFGGIGMARILAIGGAHIDRKGWLDARTGPAPPIPAIGRAEPGGGVFNAARNLARLGHQVTLVAPRGGDGAAASWWRGREAQAGLRIVPLTFLDRATPSYTAILEPDGNLVTALADMALYDLVPARRLLTVAAAQVEAWSGPILLMDSNLPESALAGLAEAAACARPAACSRLRSRRPRWCAGSLAEPCWISCSP
jgi:pseudouridine kinase